MDYSSTNASQILSLPPSEAVARITTTINDELRPALERLEEFAALEPDWDSYGAERISRTAIDRARMIAAQVITSHALHDRPADYSFAVVPLAHGGVQLEWEVMDRYLEVEVGPSGELAYLSVERGPDHRHSIAERNVPVSRILGVAEDIIRSSR